MIRPRRATRSRKTNDNQSVNKSEASETREKPKDFKEVKDQRIIKQINEVHSAVPKDKENIPVPKDSPKPVSAKQVKEIVKGYESDSEGVQSVIKAAEHLYGKSFKLLSGHLEDFEVFRGECC